MRIFLDTSSLVKLYHREPGTKELENLFSNFEIEIVRLTELSLIEFYSAIWKKVRMLEINQQKAEVIINLFERDFKKYMFIPINSAIIEMSKNFITKYGLQGLRALDAIQLSTAALLINQVDLFKTGDKLLQTFLEAEGLPTNVKA